jgi:hypothetical protein
VERKRFKSYPIGLSYIVPPLWAPEAAQEARQTHSRTEIEQSSEAALPEHKHHCAFSLASALLLRGLQVADAGQKESCIASGTLFGKDS